MSSITTRSGKGSPLTNSEVDANFTNLNTDKLENITSESIKSLSDVYSSMSPSDGQALVFDSTNGWQAENVTTDTSALMPKAGGTFTGDVTFDGATAGRDIVFDRSSNSLEFADNAEAKFGNGGDLEIRHTGAESIIYNYNGNLTIRQLKDDADVAILTDNGSGGTAYYFLADGSTGETLLYHYGSEKLATKSSGISVTGNITVSGTVDGRDIAAMGTKLDGVETNATADQTKADIDALNINADLLDGQHGSYYTGYTDTAISNLVDSSPSALNTLNELAAALGDDANFSSTITTSIGTKLPKSGGTMTGNINLNTQSLTFSDSSNQYSISSASSSALKIQAGAASGQQIDVLSNTIRLQNQAGTKTGLQSTPEGATTLYHNNAAKIATSSSGISVTGNITVSGTVDGRDIATDGTKLDGIAAGANVGIATTGGTFTGDVTFDGDAADIHFDKSHDALAFRQGAALKFVSSAATNQQSRIQWDGNRTHWETFNSTRVDLDGDFRLVGQSYNVEWDKSDNALEFADNAKATFGAGGDLSISQTSTNSEIDHNGTGQLIVKSNNKVILRAGQDAVEAFQNGAVLLYHNGLKKFETTSSGATVTGTLAATALTGDGSGLTNLPAQSSDVVDDTSPQLGGDLDANNNAIRLGDNSDYFGNGSEGNMIIMGADEDFRIFKGATNNYIRSENGGNLLIQGHSQVTLTSNTGENMAQFTKDGSARLFHNGSKKVETSSTGIDISGRIDTSGTEISFNTSSGGGITFGNGYFPSVLSVNPNNAKLYLQNDASNKQVFYANTTGMLVGNGSSPSEKLDVQGNINLTGDIKFSGSADEKVGAESSRAFLTGNLGSQLRAGNNTKVAATTTGVELTGATIQNGDFTFTGDSYNAVWDKSDNALEFGMLAKAKFNSNLEIFGGTHSEIHNTASGNQLIIRQNAPDQDINFMADSGNGSWQSVYIKIDGSEGEVKLYHYGNEKLATKSTGVSVTGTLAATAVTGDGSGLTNLPAQSDATKMPLSGGTFTGDVTFDGDAANIIFDKSHDALDFRQAAAIKWTTSSGTNRSSILYDGTRTTWTNLSDYPIRIDGSFEVVSGSSSIASFETTGVDLYYANSKKFETTSSGVTVTGDVNSTSDIRAKKNIETIEGALEKVSLLRGVTFDWDNDVEERATGVIAQDVEKVLPEAVRDNAETGFKSVAYGNMVGLLVEAIKEQQIQIDDLKSEIQSMKS